MSTRPSHTPKEALPLALRDTIPHEKTPGRQEVNYVSDVENKREENEYQTAKRRGIRNTEMSNFQMTAVLTAMVLNTG